MRVGVVKLFWFSEKMENKFIKILIIKSGIIGITHFHRRTSPMRWADHRSMIDQWLNKDMSRYDVNKIRRWWTSKLIVTMIDLHLMMSVTGLLVPLPSVLAARQVKSPAVLRSTLCSTRLWSLRITPAEMLWWISSPWKIYQTCKLNGSMEIFSLLLRGSG